MNILSLILLQVEALSKAEQLIVTAVIVFLIGRIIIGLLNKLFRKILIRRNVELSIRTFLGSMVNILLTVLLIISVVGALGVETTSFAALLASAGVAIGMALSGNLQNFAGGLMVLLFKPYKVGDVIEAQSVNGTVKEIQIFHTILTTFDNKVIYVPNGALSSGVITNYSNQATRRVDWVFGIEYGEDYERVKSVIERLAARDERILTDPLPFIALHALADSSVNVTLRVWVKSEDYWGVYFDMNQKVYETFNSEGISFPFPQLTVHQN
jgi:small conductance mechanosensitive channel